VNLKLAAKKTSDPDIISNVSALMSLIKQKESEVLTVKSPWNVVFDLSLNYTTNPLGVSELDYGSKESQYSLNLSVGRNISFIRGFRITPNYDLTFDQSFKSSDDRFVEHELNTSLKFFNSFGSINIKPSYSKQESEKKDYLSKVGGSIQLNVNYRKFWSTSIRYITSENTPADSELSYLNGNSNSISISQNFSTEKFTFNTSFSLTNDSFKDEPDNVLSKKAVGATIGLYFYPLEVFNISTSINYLREVYSQDPLSGFVRKNTQTSLSLGVSYDLSKVLNIYFNSNLSIDDGNLDTQRNEVGVSLTEDLYEFDEQVSVGLTWYIL